METIYIKGNRIDFEFVKYSKDYNYKQYFEAWLVEGIRYIERLYLGQFSSKQEMITVLEGVL